MSTLNTLDANFFWVGKITPYEILCYKSFADNGFNVKVWTYKNFLEDPHNLLIKYKINLYDANNILDESLLFKFTQGGKKGSISSFSNLFRFTLILKNGGWWFDSDCVCLKNSREYQILAEKNDFVLGKEYDLHVGSSVIFINKKEWAEIILNEIKYRIKMNNYAFYWGEIGPNLITEVLVKHNKIDELQDQYKFYSIEAKNFQDIYKTKKSILEKLNSLTNDSYSVHLWNEIGKKHIINKNILPPKDSYLFYLFKTYNLDEISKTYSKFSNFRFIFIFSKFLKLSYKIKNLIW